MKKLILCALFASCVHAYSTGGNTGGDDSEAQSCDAIDICVGGICPDGMHKVGPPSRSAAYNVRSGTGPDPMQDATEYVPGETVTVTISVVQKLIQRKKTPTWCGKKTPNYIINADSRQDEDDKVSGCADPATCCVPGTPVCYCSGVAFSQDWESCVPFMKLSSSENSQINRDIWNGLPCTTPRMESSNYLGLLMYAVDENEMKVGAWELSTTPPARFWIPTDPGCEGKAVMHVDAQLKDNVHSIVFRAPAAGTGPITFRVLLKQGDTNGGAFYWPLAPAMGATQTTVPVALSPSGDLTLTEKNGAPAAQDWYVSEDGISSCDEVCSRQYKVCDLAALTAVAEAADPTAAIVDATARWYTSTKPTLAGCSSSMPLIADTSERWLFFHKTTSTPNTCSADQITAPSCSAKPAAQNGFKLRRLCPCKSGRRRMETQVRRGKGATTAGCPHFESENDAIRRRLNMAEEESNFPDTLSSSNPSNAAAAGPAITMTTLACTVTSLFALSMGSGTRNTLILPLLLLTSFAVLPSTDAHNWINGPARVASRLAMIKPCPSRMNVEPHLHVNPGQEFNLEWASGHNGRTFFVAVRAEDVHNLALLNPVSTADELLLKYLDEEPPESKIFAHSRWNQRQLSVGYDYSTSIIGWKWRWLLNEGTETFPETDPDYIFRSAAHQCTPSEYEDSEAPEKHRRGTQNCSQSGWSDPTPTHPNGVNDRSGRYVRQNLYPKNIATIPRRAHYENKDLPWIVQAHTFNMAGKLPKDIATARFMFPVGTPPGEYVMHWYYAGYANCIDIAVMPPDVVVPDTSFAKWGITTPGSFVYGRIDHCLYGGGIVRSMNFPPITEKYCPYGSNRQGCSVDFDQALPSGVCATSISDARQCFVVPPHGATNRLGETRAEAIAACTARCTATGSKGNFESNEQKCAGVNVVPLDIPDVITFKNQSSSRSTTIPFGISNCDESCFGQEPNNGAGSSICYPVSTLHNSPDSGQLIVVNNDATSEIWHGTCFAKQKVTTFPGLPVTCKEYRSDEYPEGLCNVAGSKNWKFGAHCISCEQMEYNANASNGEFFLPTWTLLPADECHMCGHVSLASAAAESRPDRSAVSSGVSTGGIDDTTSKQAMYAIVAALGANAFFLVIVLGILAVAILVIHKRRKDFHSTTVDDRDLLRSGTGKKLKHVASTSACGVPDFMTRTETTPSTSGATTASTFKTSPSLPLRPASFMLPSSNNPAAAATAAAVVGTAVSNPATRFSAPSFTPAASMAHQASPTLKTAASVPTLPTRIKSVPRVPSKEGRRKSTLKSKKPAMPKPPRPSVAARLKSGNSPRQAPPVPSLPRPSVATRLTKGAFGKVTPITVARKDSFFALASPMSSEQLRAPPHTPIAKTTHTTAEHTVHTVEVDPPAKPSAKPLRHIASDFALDL